MNIKSTLSSLFLDMPRYGMVVDWPSIGALLGRSWIDLHNRGERLNRDGKQRGVLCDWRWTSDLYYCRTNPEIGRRLLRRALSDWPIEFRDAPAISGPPVVSFIIGHRGQARLPHLLVTLASIAGQREVPFECLVVEQAPEKEITQQLPTWVRHVHTPPPIPDMPYSRSWAFNVGARLAQGKILVCHDNDILAPAAYAAELARVHGAGFEAARLQRFLFNLSEQHSLLLFDGERDLLKLPPVEVVQNWAGGTLAIDKDVYLDIGGHDESFVGWGGEDNEMFDRLKTRRLHDHSYLPFVHLYHAPQPQKQSNQKNSALLDDRMTVPAAQRCVKLRNRSFGDPRGPAGIH